ncbi:hypothetical protein FAX15_20210 [Escherichia coli]|uniref:hypothetical protein n=1 Tax=Escherichia coli TaxID=562 RepID=UPI0011503CD7|nr:hypothetical protein [Escherichia coli]TLD73862.1 hypothetical protein FAX15_20210 [Escherichia coli]
MASRRALVFLVRSRLTKAIADRIKNYSVYRYAAQKPVSHRTAERPDSEAVRVDWRQWRSVAQSSLMLVVAVDTNFLLPLFLGVD